MVDRILKEMIDGCVLARSRIISRVMTRIYDDALAPFGVSSAQFVLLSGIAHLGAASRSEIGRYTQQDRSTLSRNIKLLLDAGFVQEIEENVSGRVRPLEVSPPGIKLMHLLAPAWRMAQAEAKGVLGEAGTVSVMTVGDEIFGLEGP